MFGLGTPELVIILVIILLLFGGAQLPKLARSMGASVKELRDGLKDGVRPAADKSTTVAQTDEETGAN